jgi:hypothetical protein
MAVPRQPEAQDLISLNRLRSTNDAPSEPNRAVAQAPDRAATVPIESERKLFLFTFDAFSHANRYPLRAKTL